VPPARPCLDCGEFTIGTRCPDCATPHRRRAQRRQDAQRGTSTQRGYGAAHQALRASLAPAVAAGEVDCWRCGRVIGPDEAWHLGHAPRPPGGAPPPHAGAEHARCNIDASNGS